MVHFGTVKKDENSFSLDSTLTKVLSKTLEVLLLCEEYIGPVAKLGGTVVKQNNNAENSKKTPF